MGCGYLITPLRHARGFQDGSSQQWSMSINDCATSPRAIVKKVTFQYNDTGTGPSLNGLKVVEVKPKVYASTKDMPFWGIEKVGNDLSMEESQSL